jgi:1-phosphofructokinase
VTRFLSARGSESVAVLPVGGSIGRALVGLLDEAQIPYRAIPIAGRTRANVTIKPNDEQLGEILGRPLDTLEEVLAGCEQARARGAGAVICSLGSKGAVLVDDAGRWSAAGAKVPVRSTVGAGDSLLAGFLHAGGTGPHALAVGIAWATAAVQTPGTGVPDPALIDLDAVRVDPIPSDG